MRLFLMLWMIALAGCSRGGEVEAGAVRVEVFYATFRPGCLTVTVQDEADASRVETQQLQVDERLSDDKRVAVFPGEGWSRNLRVTASARERSCAGAEVASSTQVVEMPESGAAVAYLDLRAEELDGDGYVSARAPQRGTDCDDGDPAVNPGATETCDGVDNNCSGNEFDALELLRFYVDADGDGYGDSLQVRTGCAPPAGTVAEGGDCHDGDAAVHPGQAEQRCDGLDDNCDGSPDEDFQVNAACETALGCVGARACMADGSGAECVSSQVPTEWYVDADGDGRAGTSVGLSCATPPGAVATKDDCDDDGSRFTGGAEVCDRLDNDCNGQVDEGVCAGVSWTSQQLGGSAAWEAVAAWGRGKTWLAGTGGKVTHVDGATVTDLAGCAGDWKSAWARPSDGRVFLGSTQGVLTTTTVAGGTCDPVTVAGV
ncbi:MAG TPA: putative metal-binding motif-containing protein, partial [Myxococcaceae bacterium]|nr:putative metal-binding motif-containing protein [Myxococcaceae bacterium]